MVGTRERTLADRSLDQRGYTLVEFLIAALITTTVVGSSVALAMQLQQSYSTQLDDTTVEQEMRFALEWIAGVLRSAGSNPYGITMSSCPQNNTLFQKIRIDPNGNTIMDDVRVQADINPPNGLLGGPLNACTERNEDVLIAHVPGSSVITKQDMSLDGSPVVMTEPIITELRFTYLNAARAVTTTVESITYAQIRVTGQSQAWNNHLGGWGTSSMETEVRLRTE